jgi:3-oxoacyl-[acyl-carrier protein] reductase
VAVTYNRSQEEAQRTTDAVRAAGRRGAAIEADLTDAAACARAVERTVAALGRLDILVHMASIYTEIKFDALTPERFDRNIAVDLRSGFLCSRAAVPHMRAQGGGTIVNLSSTAGKRPSTGMPNYTVTKAAVLSLSRLVADTYAKDGIRCNAVAPGPTATEAWLGAGGLADQQPGTRDEVLAKVGAGRPLGRLAEPGEIASVVVFLCSERASYVTGAAWSADGGTVPVIL